MNPWVKEKLAQIDELYPRERLERSRERIRRLWTGELPADRYPFVYSPMTLNYYDVVMSPEERLRRSLDEHIARGRIDDDFIPSLFPGCRQGTFPSMYRAPEVAVGGDYSSERLPFGLTELDRLAEPSLGPGTVAHEWLEMERYFLEETEGRLPVNVTDMQGPVEVCAKLWGYEDFFLTAADEPELCLRVMDRLTEGFILFWQAQQDLLGENFVGTHLWGWNWVPEGLGATISSDGVVMVSADFYREFYNPSTVRIGEHFGGVTIHSCGDFAAVMGALTEPACVRGVHAGQMRLPALLAAGVPEQVVCTAFSNINDCEAEFRLARERRARCNLTIGGLWPNATPQQWSDADWRELRARHERVKEWAATA